MRKSRDIEVMRILAEGPKTWPELEKISKERLKLSKGGLSYVLKKLMKEKLVDQPKKRGEYILTNEGVNEVRKYAIIESLKNMDIFKRIHQCGFGFFEPLIYEELGEPVAYLFYPTKYASSYFPKGPLNDKEKEKLLKVIELAIRTLYEKIDFPYKQTVVNYNSDLGIFHVKITKEQMKLIKKFVQQGKAPNEATAFRKLIEKGLNELAKGEVSPSLSLSKNKKRWPHIYEAWMTGQFGKNILEPFRVALDLLEKKLEKEAKK